MVVQNLIAHIRKRLETAKSCTVFENDLERVWPREKLHREKRERAILMFAQKNGWAATVLDPGIRVTFRKVPVAKPGNSEISRNSLRGDMFEGNPRAVCG